jgi:hypothetical protein
VLSSFVVAVAAIVAVIESGIALGIGTVVLWIVGAVRVWRKVSQTQTGPFGLANVLPAYLIAVPVLVTLLQLTLVDRAVASSRHRAIRNAGPLIEAITMRVTTRPLRTGSTSGSINAIYRFEPTVPNV